MRIFLPLAAAAATLAAAPAPAPAPVHVGGRAAAGAHGALTFGWPGAYVESRIRGTGFRVRVGAPADHLRLLVDGEEKLVFRAAGEVDATVGALPPGEHVVRLEKLTESQTGGSIFRGFFPAAGAASLPPRPRSRRIEFIGDSYTVGYGNRSQTRECTRQEVHDRTDTQAAFGPIAARRFGADYRVHAFSGFGIVRNYNGSSPGLSLPAIYDRAAPGAAGRANDAGWEPHLIVVNLGTNDFSTPLKPGERWRDPPALRAAYREAYVGFVRMLRARHPRARFILMGSDAFFGEVEQVAARLGGGTEALRFDGLELGGCDWHPSLADHRRLAGLLEAAIIGLGIWPAPAEARQAQ